MINAVSYSQVNFSGKSFRDSKKFAKEASRFAEEYSLPGYDVLQAYKSQVFSHPRYKVLLEKKIFGYSSRESSILPKCEGTVSKLEGISTEALVEKNEKKATCYGGGWLRADISTPLSTKDVHTCSAVHLVDDGAGEHFLYHVHHDTPQWELEAFLLKEFPYFNKINIFPGDALLTQKTTEKILESVANINSKADINFYHSPVENPELVAYKGALSFLPPKDDGKMTFKEVCQYDNIISQTA